jgi:hypothetical protein
MSNRSGDIQKVARIPLAEYADHKANVAEYIRLGLTRAEAMRLEAGRADYQAIGAASYLAQGRLLSELRPLAQRGAWNEVFLPSVGIDERLAQIQNADQHIVDEILMEAQDGKTFKVAEVKQRLLGLRQQSPPREPARFESKLDVIARMRAEAEAAMAEARALAQDPDAGRAAAGWRTGPGVGVAREGPVVYAPPPVVPRGELTPEEAIIAWEARQLVLVAMLERHLKEAVAFDYRCTVDDRAREVARTLGIRMLGAMAWNDGTLAIVRHHIRLEGTLEPDPAA